MDYINNDNNMSKLVECIVSSNLLRLIRSIHYGLLFDISNCLFYWISKNSGEVDFIVKFNDRIRRTGI